MSVLDSENLVGAQQALYIILFTTGDPIAIIYISQSDLSKIRTDGIANGQFQLAIFCSNISRHIEVDGTSLIARVGCSIGRILNKLTLIITDGDSGQAGLFFSGHSVGDVLAVVLRLDSKGDSLALGLVSLDLVNSDGRRLGLSTVHLNSSGRSTILFHIAKGQSELDGTVILIHHTVEVTNFGGLDRDGGGSGLHFPSDDVLALNITVFDSDFQRSRFFSCTVVPKINCGAVVVISLALFIDVLDGFARAGGFKNYFGSIGVVKHHVPAISSFCHLSSLPRSRSRRKFSRRRSRSAERNHCDDHHDGQKHRK